MTKAMIIKHSYALNSIPRKMGYVHQNLAQHGQTTLRTIGTPQPDLKEALKRVCGYIHNKGGVIKSMENHGEKVLPISMKKDHVKYSHGNYFFMGVHLPADNRQDLSEVIDGDLDILFHRVMKETVEPPRPCLFRPCQFGEIVKPDYDRSLFKTNTIRKLKNRKVLRK